MYISKNNELNQEFYFAHPKTKIWINNVYNTSFYGAPLWDSTSRNLKKLEKNWNVYARMMLGVPRTTHKYLIEPLTGTHHITKSLWNRFLRFVCNIADGKKMALKYVLAAVGRQIHNRQEPAIPKVEDSEL